MRRSTLTALSLAALAPLTVAEAASAQSTTRGFTIGLHASGASLSVENQDRSNAGGGGLFVGVGVNRKVTIFTQIDGSEFDNQSGGDIEGKWTMGHFDLGVRFNFANSLRSYVPFLQGALGYRAVSVTDPVFNNNPVEEVTFSGAGVTLGGGVDIYLSESWAIDLQLLWTGGEFTTLRVDNVSVSGLNFEAQSSRFNVGVMWWP